LQLTEIEQEMASGQHGAAVRRALAQQIAVGEFFGAERFVPVRSVHLMATYESMGDAGYRFFEGLRAEGARFETDLTTNPGCVDPAVAATLRQDPTFVRSEGALVELQRQLGALTVQTCINYQTAYQPHVGEHVAWGDTGTVAWANSILGARSNYESGPAAVAAGLTGRTPAYGYHVDAQRVATVHVRISFAPRGLAEWGALGAAIGWQIMDYWTVPALEFDEPVAPSPDEHKQLAASIAAHGSLAMFHIVGVTPEAPTRAAAFGGREAQRILTIGRPELDAVFAHYGPFAGPVRLVVFTAPQLSIWEIREITRLLAGRRIAEGTRLILTTNDATLASAESQGYRATLEAAGALVVKGTCWYIMQPEKQREAFGWTDVVTNSAKLANNIGGARYRSVLLPTEACIEAAVRGSLP
jgi:predicted aconitase